jgi:hypothetical protein
MLDFPAHRKDLTVAFVAALVLLLQTFLSSWALAAQPVDAASDAFGNVLCVTSTDDGPGPDAPLKKIPNCCTLGCNASPSVLPAPSAGAATIPAARAAIPVVFPSVRAPSLARPDHEPGSPRAPPQTA